MKMNRKQFIGSLVASAVMPSFAIDSRSEFEKCRDDILYWVDNHLKAYGAATGELKMSPQQREYLKRMSEVKDILVCAKGRQIGASTANLVFAHWKTRFFENQHVFIVEPSQAMARRTNEMNACMFHNPASPQEGSWIHITTPSGIERGVDLHDRNNTFIIDEFAWWSNRPESFELSLDLYNAICDGNPRPTLKNIIAVSTPTDHVDLFSILMEKVDSSRKLVLPSPTRGLEV